jgi:polyribonucleotide nucleotidyltransferase
MQQSIHTTSVQIGDHEIKFETGRVANQANGAVVLTCKDTSILATACNQHSKDDIDFFPLRVDYVEKFSSAGKTLGGFIKREGRPSEREILVCRLIDRPIRPMFPEGYFDEVQLLSFVWSYDDRCPPDVLAINAVSAALVISDIPLIKPIGAVRIALVDGQLVVNPSLAQMKLSKLDLVLAGTHEAILMVEGSCNFLTEEQLLEAIELGHQNIKKICEALDLWRQLIGKEKHLGYLRVLDPIFLQEMRDQFSTATRAALHVTSKQAREIALHAVSDQVMSHYSQATHPHLSTLEVQKAFNEMKSHVMRESIITDGIRIDGRRYDEIRPITIETGILPRTHGSCLFTRGETQAMAVCTLGSDSMGQRFEDLNEDGLSHFYLQYSFPPFSVGEVGRMGPASRREVGHGKLAERALTVLLPARDKFSYNIRVESTITACNGSSSMASVCGGCLAMMDAGVPIERPVAGVAMGLIVENNQYKILSDILGAEDALGDMDFKIAGDDKGITAFQMDIKVEGITLEIMKDALHQAKAGRIYILEQMLKAYPHYRKELSPYAPRIISIQIKPSQIGTVIGPKGKQIRSIIESCGPNVTIDIDESGLVSICGTNVEGIQAAEKIVRNLVAEVEVGKIYDGVVTELLAFGVIVQIIPGKDGLCHVSEMDSKRVAQPGDLAKVGDTFRVKVLEVNDRGQIKLSRKATLTN